MNEGVARIGPVEPIEPIWSLVFELEIEGERIVVGAIPVPALFGFVFQVGVGGKNGVAVRDELALLDERTGTVFRLRIERRLVEALRRPSLAGGDAE